MLLNKEQIIDRFKGIFINSTDKKFILNLQDYIVSHNIMSIVNYKTVTKSPNKFLELYQDEELIAIMFKFIEGIEHINPRILKIADCFNVAEINKYKYFVPEVFDVKKLHIFKNVYPKLNNNKQFSFLLSVEDIAMLSRYGVIRVDANFQRQSRLIRNEITNTIMRQIQCNPGRVETIANLLADNKYYFDEIRFNLMDEEDSVLSYNSEDNTLYWEGDCVIPDGNHRRLACEKAYFDHPELKEMFRNQKFSVSFTYLTTDELKRMIEQIWDIEPIRKQQKSAMKTNNSNKIIDSILRSNNADDILKNGIVNTGIEIRAYQGFIIKSILAEAIEDSYNIDDTVLAKNKQIELSEWITEFYNYIIELWVDDLSDLKTVRKNTWKSSAYLPFGLMLLSKEVRGKQNWKEITKSIIEKIDWDKSAAILKHDQVPKSQYSTKDKKVMLDFFKEVMKNGII
ncbi:MAG: hypothetical protein RR847_04875 [Bacilli bacterium]